jgi:hypothetical protein
MSNEREFELFWLAYPRKVGKLLARKTYQKLKPPLEDVLKALEWQKRSDQWKKDFGAFIPHPTTWLSQGRWDDEPPQHLVPKKEQPEEKCTICRNNTGLVYSAKHAGMVVAECKHGKSKNLKQ